MQGELASHRAARQWQLDCSGRNHGLRAAVLRPGNIVIVASLGTNKRCSPTARAAGYRSVYQEVFQNIFIVSRDEWPLANFAIDRQIDRFGSRIHSHDFVTCLALRTPKLLSPILGHSLTKSAFSKCGRVSSF